MATVSDRRHSSVKRVVVTGGAGFLGSHICEALVAQGAHVICVDDLSTSSKQNVAVLEGSGALDLVVADVSAGLEQVTGPVSAVLHLASPASPPDFLAHPLETMAAGAEARVTRWRWPLLTVLVSFWRHRAKCTENPPFTLSRSPTGELLIRSGCAVCMTRRSDLPRP
jgi:hypothetical protein